MIHLGIELLSSVEVKNTWFGRPFILYVGQRGGYKNFKSLLRVFASTPALRDEFKLVAFGGGIFSDIEKMELRRFGLTDKDVISIEGDDQVLMSLYASAHCMVYPSMYEGFGMPPLEAMSFGCPVVCSNAGSLPEIAGDGAYMVSPENLDDIRVGLEEVCYNMELRGNLKHRGRLRTGKFSWDVCGGKTKDVYTSLV